MDLMVLVESRGEDGRGNVQSNPEHDSMGLDPCIDTDGLLTFFLVALTSVVLKTMPSLKRRMRRTPSRINHSEWRL